MLTVCYACRKSELPQSFVTRDESEFSCDPPLCNGSNLSDIPYADGRLPVSVAVELKLYDTQSIRQRLANKCVVLLGDSTMQETAHDLIILLSGIGNNHALLQDYLRQATRQDGFSKVCVPLKSSDVRDLEFVPLQQDMADCDDGVEVHFYGNHRNMSVYIHSLGFGLRTRYTGHHLLTENGGGIQTFFVDDFQAELEQLVSRACNGKSTDILIVNTGHHDFAGKLRAYKRHERLNEHEEFADLLFKFGARLGALARTGIKVVWKENYGGLAEKDPWLDNFAHLVMTRQKVLFVDCKTIVDRFLRYFDKACFTYDDVHYGALSFFHSESKSILLSSMVTQRVLGAVVN